MCIASSAPTVEEMRTYWRSCWAAVPGKKASDPPSWKLLPCPHGDDTKDAGVKPVKFGMSAREQEMVEQARMPWSDLSVGGAPKEQEFALRCRTLLRIGMGWDVVADIGSTVAVEKAAAVGEISSAARIQHLEKLLRTEKAKTAALNKVCALPCAI